MMIDLGKSEILKRKMPQTVHGLVGCDFSAANVVEQFADGVGVQGGSDQLSAWADFRLAL